MKALIAGVLLLFSFEGSELPKGISEEWLAPSPGQVNFFLVRIQNNNSDFDIGAFLSVLDFGDQNGALMAELAIELALNGDYFNDIVLDALNETLQISVNHFLALDSIGVGSIESDPWDNNNFVQPEASNNWNNDGQAQPCSCKCPKLWGNTFLVYTYGSAGPRSTARFTGAGNAGSVRVTHVINGQAQVCEYDLQVGRGGTVGSDGNCYGVTYRFTPKPPCSAPSGTLSCSRPTNVPRTVCFWMWHNNGVPGAGDLIGPR